MLRAKIELDKGVAGIFLKSMRTYLSSVSRNRNVAMPLVSVLSSGLPSARFFGVK